MHKKNLIFIVYFILIIFISSYASAASQSFSIDNGYKWLNKTINEKSWNRQIDEISLTILALNSGGYSIEEGIKKLDNSRSDDGSWNGNIYDTSWAAYALYKTKNDVSKSLEWLLNKQIQAAITGDWLLQIKTTNSGKCSVSLNDNEAVEFDVDSSGVNCNSNGINTWIDLRRCANFNIGMNDTLNVNCNNLGNADISLIYKQDNNYYILDSKPNSKFATFSIENTYFGDYESTLYATWVLYEAKKQNQVYTLPYLESNVKEENTLDRAILLMITNNNNYADYLRDAQNNLTGSWDEGSVYDTALVLYALKKSSKNPNSIRTGVQWLQDEQNKVEGSVKLGSWKGELIDSAMAIFAIAGDSNRMINLSTKGICGNNIVEGTEACDAEYDEYGNLTTGNDSRCRQNERCAGENENNPCTCQKIRKPVAGCDNSDDCEIPSIYECKEKKCLLKEGFCAEDDDCDEGKECDSDIHKCIKISKPECTSDENCGDESVCENGKCEPIPGYCKVNTDCEEGQHCNKKINRCEEGSEGIPLWIITFGVIIVLGLIFFIVIKKGGIKIKSNKPKTEKPYQPSPFRKTGSTQPQKFQRPIQPQRNFGDEKLEKELDESIKKAKDMMGKK